MPGIIPLYSSFAEDHVQLHRKKGTLKEISRAKFELQLLSELENAEFPIEYKLSFYHVVLASLEFEPFWLSISQHYDLPESCTARYVTDQALLEFEAPTEDDAEEVAKKCVKKEVDYEADDESEDEIHNETHDDADAVKVISPVSGPSSTPATLITNHEPRSPTPDSDDGSSSASTDTELLRRAAAMPKRTLLKCDKCNMIGHSARYCNTIEWDDVSPWESEASSQLDGGHEAKENARRMYASLPKALKRVNKPVAESLAESVTGPVNKRVDQSVNELHDLIEDPRATLGDANGLTREEGDDGEYQDSPSKGKGKAKAISTVKGASKPKGVTKNRATPKQKQQTPAQLKTAAAKSREPVKPAKTKKASTKNATPIKKEQKTAQLDIAAAKTLEFTNPTATEKPATGPSQAVTTPAHASYNGSNKQTQAATLPNQMDKKIARVQASMGPGQERGTKRSLEQLPNDEEDSPATKVAKVGGAASVNGGRKKATPKKSKQKGFQEWDGVHRGFGEY